MPRTGRPENLTNLREHPEIARERALKGAKKRRQRKVFRETLEAMLEMKAFDGIKCTNMEAMCRQLIMNVLDNADAKSFEVVRDTVGQRPTDKLIAKQELSLEGESIAPSIQLTIVRPPARGGDETPSSLSPARETIPHLQPEAQGTLHQVEPATEAQPAPTVTMRTRHVPPLSFLDED